MALVIRRVPQIDGGARSRMVDGTYLPDLQGADLCMMIQVIDLTWPSKTISYRLSYELSV